MAKIGMGLPEDPFLGPDGKPRIVRGVSVISNAPRIVELAGYVGFETVWIEVEHGTVGFTEVETLCTACAATGTYPTVRIPDNSRTHVLRAVEAGARILIVPMINTAEEAQAIVTHGKFTPLGKRGYNTRSRGVEYGLESPPTEAFARANRRTHFFAQIETVEGVENLEAICRVEGLAGIFIGPGDLSADLGKPGQFSDPGVIEVVVSCVRKAKAAGLHVGILVVSGPLLEAAIQEGCDLIFSGGDIANLAKAWESLLETLPS